jgi:hypothetical protein
MKNKSDILACFRDFDKGVQTQYRAIVKVLRFDNGSTSTKHLGNIYHLREFNIKSLAHTHQSRMG